MHHLKSTVVIIAGLSLLSVSSAQAKKIPKDASLMPEGEKELMADHDVNPETITYRSGKGLQVRSADKKHNIVTRLRLQTLGTVSNASGEPAEMGIILRRARLQFIGNTFGEHNKFKAEFAFSPRDLRFHAVGDDTYARESPLLSWYWEFDHLRDLTLRVGQYKIPYSRQRVISSGNQQMVDRSIANGEFTLDRDIGFDIRSKDFLGLGFMKYYLGVYNGEGRSAFDNGDSNLMYLGRVEFLPFGMFKDYSEGDFERLARPGVSIGLAYGYAPNALGKKVNRSGRPADRGTTDFQNLAADVTFKYQGLALSSEVFWREGERESGGALDGDGMEIPTEDARNGLGWMAQAGYLLPRSPIEITGRFGQIIASDESALSDSNEAGMAFSYYFAQHPFKLQGDAFQLWGGDDAFTDGTTRVRVQMQMAF